MNGQGNTKRCNMETNDTEVRKKLIEIQRMGADELKGEWHRLYRTEPPAYGEQFMRRRLAYRVQELAYGGMDGETIARIDSVNERLERKTTGEIMPGAVIVREWRGRRYEVKRLKDGFEWEGRLFGSLTAVATAITGVHRNGNAFFNMAKEDAGK